MPPQEVTISQDDAIQFKKDIIVSYKAKLYSLQAEQKKNVEILIATKDGDEKRIADMKDGITQMTAELVEAKKKTTKADRNYAKKLENGIAATNMLTTQLIVERSDAYKSIVERASKIRDMIEWIAFYTTFDGFVPRLPYIEIEGTRYASTPDNQIKLDDQGNKVIFIESNEQKNPA